MVLFDTTLNVPPLVFFLIVKLPFVGHKMVPLVADKVKFPALFACLLTVTVLLIVLSIYHALVAFIDTVYVLAPVTFGTVVLKAPPFSEYSTFASVGVTFTLLTALWATPSYAPV